jgi:hypothetical protein
MIRPARRRHNDQSRESSLRQPLTTILRPETSDRSSGPQGGSMFRLLIPIVLAAAIVGAVIGARRRRRRRGDATPQLHQHPERLDQMLDSTDDA